MKGSSNGSVISTSKTVMKVPGLNSIGILFGFTLPKINDLIDFLIFLSLSSM